MQYAANKILNMILETIKRTQKKKKIAHSIFLFSIKKKKGKQSFGELHSLYIKKKCDFK